MNRAIKREIVVEYKINNREKNAPIAIVAKGAKNEDKEELPREHRPTAAVFNAALH
jgi:hypothetical protein